MDNFCIISMESSQDCICLEPVKILISGRTYTRHIHADIEKYWNTKKSTNDVQNLQEMLHILTITVRKVIHACISD